MDLQKKQLIPKRFLKFGRDFSKETEFSQARVQGLLLRENYVSFTMKHDQAEDLLTRKYNIRSLRNFEFDSRIEEENIDYENLIIQIKKLKNYRNAAIGFRKCRNLTNYTMSSFCNALCTNKKLKSFEIQFIECFKLKDVGFSKLGKVFLKQKSLTKVDCYFYCLMHITVKGFSRFGGYLTWIRNLKDLELYFGDYAREWQHIDDASIVKFLGYVSKLQRLERLKLTMHGFRNMSDESLFGYYNYLSKLKSLKKLELLFRHRNMFTENGITKIAKLVENLSNLQDLKLDFRLSDYPGHKGFIAISNALEKLPNLLKLSLDFQKCLGIQTQSLEYFSNKLLSLTNLKKLRLNFTQCENITSIAPLAEPISKLSHLENLEIDITECRRITDEQISDLLDNLSGVQGLKKLYLGFNNLEKSYGQYIESVRKFVLNNPRLMEFYFGSAGIDDFEEKFLEILIDAVKNLKNLKIFNWDITPSKKFSSDLLDELTELLNIKVSVNRRPPINPERRSNSIPQVNKIKSKELEDLFV